MSADTTSPMNKVQKGVSHSNQSIAFQMVMYSKCRGLVIWWFVVLVECFRQSTSRPGCSSPVDSPRPCGPALVQRSEVVASVAAGYSTSGSSRPSWEDTCPGQDTRSLQQHCERAMECAATVTGYVGKATASPYCSCEGCWRCCRYLNLAGGAPRWAREWEAVHSWQDARSGASRRGCYNRLMSM